MSRARIIAALFASLVLAIPAACRPDPVAIERPACQPVGDDPTFVDHPDLNLDTPQCFPSPDHRKVAVVHGGVIAVRKGEDAFTVGATEQGKILWNSASDGFAVADSLGSGQTEVFSFVDLAQPRPSMTTRLREIATSRYQSAFKCSGPKWYANTIMDGWASTGEVRLVVQDGVHSEGCTPPGEMIGVIGDPRTGAISRVLSAGQVRREWCTAAQRRGFGYCYDEAGVAAAHR